MIHAVGFQLANYSVWGQRYTELGTTKQMIRYYIHSIIPNGNLRQMKPIVFARDEENFVIEHLSVYCCYKSSVFIVVILRYLIQNSERQFVQVLLLLAPNKQDDVWTFLFVEIVKFTFDSVESISFFFLHL